ncbi:MAG TPA: PQQ-binding-like beta-propeller repeat protein, partial [Acidobacteriaceae bacterium]|nr:PQQ-binding-like beta-propeller repeat protein [Acidobacteriaceae bacterium]
MRRAPLVAAFTVLLCSALACAQVKAPAAENGVGWPTYGGDSGGQRFSNAAQINRENVAQLHPVWTYHTHALQSGFLAVSRSDFEATPILFNDTLFLSTPFDRVIALNPETGAERWTFDPQMRKDLLASNYTSRGVAAWQSPGSGPCAARIFLATLDARLIALDAAGGKLCESFGNRGQVDLTRNIPTRPGAPYQYFGNTSPPTIVGDVVVVGSAIADNQAVDVEPGVVRGYDVRSGRLLWTWDPLPWAAAQSPRTGAGNAWGVLAADPAHNLVFVPTGAAAPDFWGGLRPGDDKDANSLVALDARTGQKVWAFQLIHHDVWDYDVASEPLLFDFQHRIPAVAIAAKTGILFVLNRLTGQPLWPIEERPVPRNGAPGDILSPTQPFSSLPPLN